MNLSNSEIAKILSEIAIYLEMDNVPFKPRAYEKAASVIGDLEESICVIYERGGLKAVEEIPGVGVSIAEKIEEIIKTGRLKYYDGLKKKNPVNIGELLSVEGLGAKSVSKLYQKLNIKNLADLEKAAKEGKIKKLEGFGEKSEQNILKSIEFVKKSGGRFVLGFATDDLLKIKERLEKLSAVEKADIVGSFRRKKETIGDGDFLVISNHPKQVMEFFVNMPEVERVYAQGETKSMVKLRNGMDADLRAVPKESYGAALQYFTGSKEHNIVLRGIALKKGFKLNEYGLFQSADKRGHDADSRGRIKEIKIAGATEEEIYEKLGLPYIEPELRENEGEIEAAKVDKLPKLIGYDDLKGDLQIQTNWTDGSNTIEEYAREAMKMKLGYIAITDHTKRLAMTGGLDEKKLLRQMAEIDRLNSKSKILDPKFRILKGSEVDILKDGSLDIQDDVLEKLDVVGAAIHSHFALLRYEQTKRLIRAMENKNVDIIFHPTCRIINKRPAIDVDMEEIIKTARRTGTVLEIDAYPDRLDFKDSHIRKCVEAKVKLSIDSDAHSVSHMNYLKWGISQARRGWAKKADIINAWPLEKMLKMLKNG